MIDNSPDALVLIAWKCSRFRELIYIGHKYYQENMLAIARLRGKALRRFEFADSDLICDEFSPYEAKTIRKVSKFRKFFLKTIYQLHESETNNQKEDTRFFLLFILREK